MQAAAAAAAAKAAAAAREEASRQAERIRALERQLLERRAAEDNLARQLQVTPLSVSRSYPMRHRAPFAYRSSGACGQP